MGLLGGGSGVGAGFHGYGDPSKGFNPAKGLHDMLGRPRGPNMSGAPGMGDMMQGAPAPERATYGTDFDPASLGLPKYKGFGSIGDMKTNLDMSGLGALETEALAGPGESPWLKLANQQQGLEETNLLNQSARSAAGQAAGAQAGLAMRGGLRGGAGERLAQNAADQSLLGQADVRNQGAMSRSGLGVQAEQMRRDDIGKLVAGQQMKAQYMSDLDKFNAQKGMASIEGRNQFNKFMYGEKAKAKGAAMTAQAIENAGLGGGGVPPWLNMLPGGAQTAGMFGGQLPFPIPGMS